VQELLRNFLENSSGLVAYGSVFGVLVMCGLGVPLPEDVSLILGGYLVHQGSAKLVLMMAVGFLGILVGDSMIYFAGRRFGSKVGRKPGGLLSRVVTPEKRARVEGLFAKHGQKIVMIARFLPGVRAVTYFTAGSAGMRYRWFILFDGIAALASAPLFVFLGYKFGGELEMLFENVKRGQVKVIAGIAVIVLAYVLVGRIRKRRAAAASARAAAAAAPEAAPGDRMSASTEPAEGARPGFDGEPTPSTRFASRSQAAVK
jgi:membrane protein DedA with SNARE-associated domain